MNVKHLIIFDFSGTLSLDAVLFGRAERLTRALRNSGLWRSGSNNLDIFWNEVVAPTWTEAATTSLGYVEALTQGLLRQPNVSVAEIRRCASVFAADYFAHSTIHAAWIPILRKLCADPAVCVCIATDHYADVTERIRAQLEAIGISASGTQPDILIANSADIGAFKAERAFWERIRTNLANESPRKISLIDDFGANESDQDSYATEAKIAARQTNMVALLTDVFRCPVEVFPFLLPDRQETDTNIIMTEFEDCVARAAMFLNIENSPSSGFEILAGR